MTSRRGLLAVAGTTGAAAALGGTAVAERSAATVTFDDQQTAGRTVTVASTTLPDGGFVAIHDATLEQGEKLQSVVGVSDYLESGTHEHVDVTLFDVNGRTYDPHQLRHDQTLIAMPHHDTNGNHEYDFDATDGQADAPYTTDGSAVVDKARVTVTCARPAATVTFDDQGTNGTEVTVASTTLPDGGFVAIHDAKLLKGEKLQSVVGVSDYLDDGAHENVTAPLFDVKGRDYSRDRLQDDQVLIAMPHHDTNGNREYDFDATKGHADAPYTTDGSAVVDKAHVTVC